MHNREIQSIYSCQFSWILIVYQDFAVNIFYWYFLLEEIYLANMRVYFKFIVDIEHVLNLLNEKHSSQIKEKEKVLVGLKLFKIKTK